MSEPSKIEPALTADEWRQAAKVYGHGRTSDASAMAWFIAVANDSLPDSDPRKITRRKVDDIREAALTQAAATARTGEDALATRLFAIADALESYLPPEDLR